MHPLFSIIVNNNLITYKSLDPTHLSQVLALESIVIATLDSPDQLRRNSINMWQRCLSEPHQALGAFLDHELIALAVLYLPQNNDNEDLAHLLLGTDTPKQPSANYKICLVHPSHRGHGLQQKLGCQLETLALMLGIHTLCATASPRNIASIHSLEKLGYTFNRSLEKYGFERSLYYKSLPQESH